MAVNLQRLIDYYHRCAEFDPEADLSTIWQVVRNDSQGELVAALESGDQDRLAAALKDPRVLFGLDEPNLIPHDHQLVGVMARRLGLLPVFNPDQPSPTENWRVEDHAELRELIEDIVGPLEIIDAFGRDNPDGNAFSYIHLQSLAQCATIQMLRHPFPQSVLEIGSGLGYFALPALQCGAASYASIDIPSTGVLGAFSLACELDEDEIWLWGEEPKCGVWARFYPAGVRIEIPDRFDLVVQSNGFPEFTTDFQGAYLDLISMVLRPGGWFYSCNHESDRNDQHSVAEAVGIDGSFRRIYRAPFMLREGYMEEIFEPIKR